MAEIQCNNKKNKNKKMSGNKCRKILVSKIKKNECGLLIVEEFICKFVLPKALNNCLFIQTVNPLPQKEHYGII